MDNLENIKKRIKALSEKTVENGCTEAEAMAAMEKVGSLLNEYNLSMSEVDMKKESCVQDYVKIKGNNVNNNIGALTSAIALFTDTKCWTDRRFEEGKVKYIFFGLESDAKLASYLLFICTKAMLNDCHKYIKSLNLVGAGNHRIPQNNFQKGFAARIYARLKEIKAANNKIQQSSGTNLIVLKNQLVKNEFDNIGINLKNRFKVTSQYDSASFNAGKEAGDKINLNNPIENQSNRLKLA